MKPKIPKVTQEDIEKMSPDQKEELKELYRHLNKGLVVVSVDTPEVKRVSNVPYNPDKDTSIEQVLREVFKL